MSENFIPLYDLESLTEPQRQEYLRAVCKHMGVPDNLNLVALTYVDETDGPARLVAYAKRGATEAVRNNLQIDIVSLDNKMIGGSIVFTAVAKSKVTGRQEISTGSKWVDGLQGAPLDDAIMTAQTRALRRVTLQFMGAGVLDESEVSQRKTIYTQSAPQFVPPQPTVQPSSAPGKDVTEEQKTELHNKIPFAVEFESGKVWNTQEEFEAAQAKMRADAIAKLNEASRNAEAGVEPTHNAPAVDIPQPKKPRKPRGPNKAKVDLGPSVLPQPDIKPDIPAAVVAPTPAPAPVVEQPKPDIPAAPPAQAKSRLTKEQLKPFRQRNFAMMEILEKEGKFLQSEGLGRSDKMRLLAGIIFPEITNMNELSAEQWDKYLTLLEQKIQKEGPQATVKFIEDTIGI
jgi:hypothetical protein